jgi:hypothetical protein
MSTATIPAPTVTPSAVQPKPFDGIAYLKKNLARQPGDSLRITKVSDTSYRCNWLAVAKDKLSDGRGIAISIMAIRQSKFITLSGEGENVSMTVHERQ